MDEKSRVSKRALVLQWAESGAIPSPRVHDALVAAGVTPDAREWRSFLDSLLLWSGASFLAVATIFFVAFNWNDIGRFTKFGLAEALIVAGTVVFVKLGSDRTSGKAGLLFASLAIGALLALVGQTYQTGADPWELFASWSFLILPWVLVGRLAGLWMLWIAIANLAIALYFQVFGGLFGVIFPAERQLWTLFAFNGLALAMWELAARRIPWLDERWAPRLLALASGGIVTGLALWFIVDPNDVSGLSLLVYPAWLAAVYAVYRYRLRDLFMLAGGCLSVIAVVMTFLSKEMLRTNNAPAFLFIAIAIVGMSAASAIWLKSVAAGEHK